MAGLRSQTAGDEVIGAVREQHGVFLVTCGL
jgi:hypothetical protein